MSLLPFSWAPAWRTWQAPAQADPGAIQDLSRYCTVCWRNARLHPDSWADCTQEVFCRLLSTVPDADWRQMLAQEGTSGASFSERSTRSRNVRNERAATRLCRQT